jgi:hypothetical protein
VFDTRNDAAPRRSTFALGQLHMRPAYLAAALAPIGLGTIIGVIIHTQYKSYRLDQTTRCMLNVLMATPGVSQPVLTDVRSLDGNHPTLRFLTADHATWFGSTRCGLDKSDKGHFCFQAKFVGMLTLDRDLESALLKRWKELCGEEAEVDVAVD